MDDPPKMLFGTLKFAQRCEAKTRQGGKCQNAPIQIGGRCRMHGGHALRGEASPRYKHGRYSKYKPVEPMDLDALIAEWAAQPLDFSWLQDIGKPFDGMELDFDLSALLDPEILEIGKPHETK